MPLFSQVLQIGASLMHQLYLPYFKRIVIYASLQHKFAPILKRQFHAVAHNFIEYKKDGEIVYLY